MSRRESSADGAARHARLRDIVIAASQLDGADRDALLDRECGEDASLRAEVRSLLNDDIPTRDALGFVDTPGATLGVEPPRPVSLPPRVGSYRLGDELGRGGMGIVFDATDERTGERVAVKILHPARVIGANGVERFLREARLGASVTHGGIVRALDAGRDEWDGRQVHWLVMEHVSGRTLRQLLRDLGAVPEGLVREILKQCAAALASIHAAGIVHRDLKPENVLITDDQRLRIMDLGVAKSSLESATLTADGQFLGTVSHAAPEQLLAKEVGPEADLYALGVTAHELLSGSNPFVREGIGATVRAHLEVTAEPPARVTPFLAEILAGLLEKDPARRLGPAGVLHAILAEGEDGAWWREREGRRQRRGSRIAVTRPTRLVGRAAEIAALGAAWRQARGGRGAVVTIESEIGIGKSRLLAEVEDLAMADGSLVVAFACRAGEGTWPLAGALAAALGTSAEDDIRERLAASPGLADLLAAFARGDAPLTGIDSIGLAFTRWAVERARAEPLVVLVDDAHEADPDMASLLRGLARGAADAPMLVVVAGRQEPERTWSQLLASTRRLAPSRLAQSDVVDLLEQLLGSRDIARRLGPRLAQRTDGVPGFTLELVRGLSDRGALVTDADGLWRLDEAAAETVLPLEARDSVCSRLGLLSRPARDLLDAAVVQGSVFDAELLAEQVDRPLVSVLQDLAELERRHGLVRTQGRLHAFDCALLREVVANSLPETLARVHHGALARVLMRRLGPTGAATPAQSADIIAHALKGSDPESAAPHVRAAVKHLEARNRHAELVDLAARALELTSLPEDARVVALTARASSLGLMGRRKEQEAVSLEAVAAAERHGDPVLLALAVLAHSMVAWARGAIDESASALETAAKLAQEAGDVRAELRAKRNLATAMARLGQFDEAIALHDWCRARAAEAGDRLTLAMATNNLASIILTRGDLERAATTYALAVDLSRDAADIRIEAHAEGGVGLVALYSGRFEEAGEHALRQAELAREIADRRGESLGLSTAGLAAYSRGRISEALGLIMRALEVSEAAGEVRTTAFMLADVGLLRTILGSFDAAREALERGLGIGRQLGHTDIEAYLISALARLAERSGRPDEALELWEQAIVSLREADVPDNLAAALVGKAGILSERGAAHAEAARAAVAEARRVLGDRNRATLAVSIALTECRLGLADPAAAIEVLAANAPRLSVLDRVDDNHSAWKLTGDVKHLAEAHRLVEHLRSHAPPARRDAMVRDVPVFAEIVEAWRSRATRR